MGFVDVWGKAGMFHDYMNINNSSGSFNYLKKTFHISNNSLPQLLHLSHVSAIHV